MTKALWFIGILVLQIVLGLAEDSKDPIYINLQILKEKKEKDDFLSYVLGLSLLDWMKSFSRPPKFINEEVFLRTLNIPDENLREFKKLNIPEESRKKLLTWTKTEFGLSSKDVLEMIRTRQCQGPNCIGIGDLGPLCCPW